LSSITKTAESAAVYKADEIEPRWRERWESDRLYETPDDSDRPKWYSLTMYPYPSGILHIGHWYAFAVPDVFARFQR
jgi:leucyl-tRNA synthetase